MSISIKEVCKRHNNLLRPNDKPSIACTLFESVSNRYNYSTAKAILESWNRNMYDFNTIMEVFDMICDHSNSSMIRSSSNLIIETIIPKVRDAKQMQTTIKRRLSLIKTKIQNNINKKIDKAKQTINNHSIHKEAVIEECYEKMLEKVNLCLQCDRVLNNHDKLSKRFSIDKYVSENLSFSKDNLEMCVMELCSFIDTYDMQFKVKYNVALENILYLMNKHGVTNENKLIADIVTDYFLLSESLDIKDMKTVIENNRFYTDLELQDVSYVISKGDGQKQFDYFFNSDEDTFSFDYNDANSLDSFVELANNKINSITKASSKAKELISAFKIQKLKSPDALKTLIKRIYTESPENIIEETPNILRMIFMFAIAVIGIAYNPFIGVLGFMTNYFISLNLQRNETFKFIDQYKKHKTMVDKKLEKSNNEEEQSRLKKYSSQLESDIKKLEDYYESLLTDKEIEDMNNKNNGELLEDAVDAAVGISLLEISMDSIDWNDCEIIDLLNDHIRTMNLDDIDSISEFCIKYPGFIDKEKLISVYESHLKHLRSQSGIERYVQIDCLKDNIRKLSSEGVTKEIKDIYSYMNEVSMFVSAIKESLEMASKRENFVLEMNFTNTIKLTIERLKKASQELSDKEKIMSRTVDSSLERLKNTMEDALTQENREAVIRGRILPPASKIIKLAITSGLAWLVNPAVAVIGLLGTFAMSAKIRIRERQLVLNEIDVELTMVEKYIQIAEEKRDMKALRELLYIKKKLEHQKSSLKYKMNVEWNHKTPDTTKEND